MVAQAQASAARAASSCRATLSLAAVCTSETSRMCSPILPLTRSP
jgi:hypothetical protein